MSSTLHTNIDTLARAAEQALFDCLERRDAPNEAELRASFAAQSWALELELRACPRKEDCPCRWPRGHQA